ncbi:MAG: ubiquinol-cytochrome C chaperone [Proteobacteria bacterium]|nr:ubiquinol-cytochrome C chaperone [Pseudomonadota bacterium]
MKLRRLFAAKPDPSAALYGAIVASARQERFYADWLVPDTVDGRFDMIVLHMFLVLDRLGQEGAYAESIRQQLTDTFFDDMDRSLREMGVGDLSVGKKVRRMAEAFYGRVTAYAKGLETGEAGLAESIARNIFADGDASHAPDVARWAMGARARLKEQAPADLTAGKVVFP